MFRASSLENAFQMYGAMLGKGQVIGWQYYKFEYYVYFKIIILGIFAFCTSFFHFSKIRTFFNNDIVKGISILVVLVLCMAYISDASFTPFIYFQF